MKNKIILGVIILIGVGIIFYWYEYRPAKIRENCSITKNITSYIPVNMRVDKEGYRKATDDEYEFCLRNNGI